MRNHIVGKLTVEAQRMLKFLLTPNVFDVISLYPPPPTLPKKQYQHADTIQCPIYLPVVVSFYIFLTTIEDIDLLPCDFTL